MEDFPLRLFDVSGFSRPQQAREWTPALIQVHDVADMMIWLASAAIPILLIGWRGGEPCGSPGPSVSSPP